MVNQLLIGPNFSGGGRGSLGEHSLTSHQLEAEAVGTLVFQSYLPREDRDFRTAGGPNSQLQV